MLYNLGTIPIVPKHIWAKDVSNLSNIRNQSTPVVGYGPWTLTGYATSQYATLTANSGFVLGAPKFHTLIIQYYADSDAAVSALRSGQLDAIEYTLTATQYSALKHAKDITVYPQISETWTAIELNPGARTQSGQHFGNGNPALTDPRVRQAIEMALNRQELVSKVWDGLAVAGSGYLPPSHPQFVWTPPASEQLSYNPAKANQLLNAAGYTMGPNGIRIDPQTHQPLVLRLGIHSDEAADAAMAPYIVEWLKAIGVGVDVQAMSFDELNADLPKGDWDMLSDTWSDLPDPSYLLSIQTCGDLPSSASTSGNTDAFSATRRTTSSTRSSRRSSAPRSESRRSTRCSKSFIRTRSTSSSITQTGSARSERAWPRTTSMASRTPRGSTRSRTSSSTGARRRPWAATRRPAWRSGS
jgi:peptide/nickel transport system substrate-binding protein